MALIRDKTASADIISAKSCIPKQGYIADRWDNECRKTPLSLLIKSICVKKHPRDREMEVLSIWRKKVTRAEMTVFATHQ